ncbi:MULTISPECIES: helix-turn-helix domain-containing protein [Burkholderia]|uniref:helix-turn-helix domain-containing protein n=1 Tax=Burkholderia TaxID=32008 RepID=UPI000D004EBD|nr:MULTISPECIES: helix-turn-helix transcriptional regulator [Burkholderia]PRE93272.1 XRE family transcriptional regulator [Burkholderia multivorans]
MQRVSSSPEYAEHLVRLGLAIRSTRKQLALSQEALADLAGIDRSHMGKIERGERNVSLLNVVRIAHALECKPSDLLRSAQL